MLVDTPTHRGPIISAGILLGTGLGGFVDGIVLHQILQWHNMLSTIRPPDDLLTMKYNMLWDGLFHAFTWLTTVAGLTRLWKAGLRSDVPWSTVTFLGALLLGWGLFNLVEGGVDHQILGIHHVHPGAGELAWDIGFLALAVVMIAVGYGMVRTGRGHQMPRGGYASVPREVARNAP
jgi:uncharacterized membrane protein